MTASTSNRKFAIVCDSSCDLPLSTLERAGVALVPLIVRMGHEQYRDCLDIDTPTFYREYTKHRGQINTYSPSEVDFLTVYQALAEQGCERIVSLHVSSQMRDVCEVARSAVSKVQGARVTVIDTHAASAEYALVFARLVLDRNAGMDSYEAVERAQALSAASRMLMVPTADANPSNGIGHKRGGILGHMSKLQRRALGVRGLVKITPDGQAEEITTSSDTARLAGVLARTLSRYSAKVGPITYAEVYSGDPKVLQKLEKPLDTNEFESACAARLRANPSTCAQIGVGAVGIAYAPASLITAEEASSILQARPA